MHYTLVYLFNKCSLNSYCTPGTVLGTSVISVTDTVSTIWSLLSGKKTVRCEEYFVSYFYTFIPLLTTLNYLSTSVLNLEEGAI